MATQVDKEVSMTPEDSFKPDHESDRELDREPNYKRDNVGLENPVNEPKMEKPSLRQDEEAAPPTADRNQIPDAALGYGDANEKADASAPGSTQDVEK